MCKPPDFSMWRKPLRRASPNHPYDTGSLPEGTEQHRPPGLSPQGTPGCRDKSTSTREVQEKQDRPYWGLQMPCSRDCVLQNVTPAHTMDNTATQILRMGFSLGWMFLVVMLLNCSLTFKHPILNSERIISEETEAIKKKINGRK